MNASFIYCTTIYGRGIFMDELRVYKDIQMRTGGEIYIGVVGPVRTGKSTFIKRFMDLMVLPGIQDVHEREQARDELPQSAAGRTIMTTEPKFIPKEAVSVTISDDIRVKIRLIDCVGFMVEGASGHMENDKDRMVRTPWYDEPIPFKKAAHIGTQKVIRYHSTIGLVITSDGSYGELAREQFVEAEEKAISELQQIGKPFIVIVNSVRPYAMETQNICKQIESSHDVKCLSFNCDQLKKEDIQSMMATLLLEFPVSQIDFYTPKWFDLLPETSPVKTAIAQAARNYLMNVRHLKDVRVMQEQLSCPYIKKHFIETISMSDGRVIFHLDIEQKYYYELLSEWLGMPVNGDYAFYRILRQLSETQSAYAAVSRAVDEARVKGYGVVAPDRRDVSLEAPVLIKHGSRYGFKIKATAPSIHMIKAGIETEIAPIVGDQAQAEELIASMNAGQQDDPQAIWETLIFGKTVGQLVEEGIQTKVTRMSENSQQKMQEAIQKIINDGSGGVIFIII